MAYVDAKPGVRSCELQARFNRTSNWDQRNFTPDSGLGYVSVPETMSGTNLQKCCAWQGERGRTKIATQEVWQRWLAVQAQFPFSLSTQTDPISLLQQN